MAARPLRRRRRTRTINDSPEAIAFSWEVTTSPVPVTGLQADGSDRGRLHGGGSGGDLTALENLLYGGGTVEALFRSPDAVIALFGTP